MNPGVRRTVLSLSIIVVLILVLIFARALKAPSLDTEQLARNGVILKQEPKALQPFTLLDHRGMLFDQARLNGKWSLVFFGYTYCPDICPTTLALLNQLNGKLEDSGLNSQIQTIMVTVDPARDTPEKLASYVSYFNKDFIGVTGESIEAVYKFALDLNSIFAKAPFGNDGDYLMDHSAYILLINPKGKLHAFYKTPHTVALLESSLKQIIAAY
jgi:protein SCO1/2